jgi:hypothetical protein
LVSHGRGILAQIPAAVAVINSNDRRAGGAERSQDQDDDAAAAAVGPRGAYDVVFALNVLDRHVTPRLLLLDMSALVR